MAVKSKRIGATGRSYSAAQPGRSLKAVVQEHGYVVKIQVDLNYNMLTDRQARGAHEDLHKMIGEALKDSAELRRSEVPLFSVEELVHTPRVKGINQL